MLAEIIKEQIIGPVYYFPRGRFEHGKDGLRIQFYPKAASPWVGVFAFGDYTGQNFTMLAEWPEANVCHIVSRCRGYVINADNPFSWEEIPLFPILDGLIFSKKNITVFCDFTSLVAYSYQTLIWRTPRISWDGIKLNKNAFDSIVGEVWDAVTDQWVPFSADLNSGEISGGIKIIE